MTRTATVLADQEQRKTLKFGFSSKSSNSKVCSFEIFGGACICFYDSGPYIAYRCIQQYQSHKYKMFSILYDMHDRLLASYFQELAYYGVYA